jgi:predicted metal-dependent peptidase
MQVQAKKLFVESHPNMHRHVRFMAALIILQKKAWAYYSVLMHCDIIWTDKVGTAGTDGVRISPEFFLSLPTDGQRAFLLAHEVGHIVLKHPARGKFYTDRGFHSLVGADKVPFSHPLYNQAADYVINADLLAHGMEPIPEGMFSDKYGRDDLADTVYLDLLDEQAENEPEPDAGDDESGEGESGDGDESEDSDSDGEDSDGEDSDGAGDESGTNGSESSDGSDSDDSDSDNESGEGSSGSGNSPDQSDDEPQRSEHYGHDEHLIPEYDGTEQEQKQAAENDKAEIQRVIDSTLDEMDKARDRGEYHVGSSDAFADAGYRHSQTGQASSVNWREELADVITRKGNAGNVTWSRIHRRRFAILGIITPTRLGTMDRMAVTIDVSGSVNRYALEQFMTELASLIDTVAPASGCLVMFTNTDVIETAEVFSGGELLDLIVPNCGGTYLYSAVQYMEQNGLTADVHLAFTDGYLEDDDYQKLAANEVVLVLDRQPHWITERNVKATGIRCIVASDD